MFHGDVGDAGHDDGDGDHRDEDDDEKREERGQWDIEECGGGRWMRGLSQGESAPINKRMEILDFPGFSNFLWEKSNIFFRCKTALTLAFDHQPITQLKEAIIKEKR